MIVVVGRPRLAADGTIAGSAGLIALAAAAAGGRVELVGSVRDDADGDTAITLLGKQRIGHAAVLRDPAGSTPRLDAADLDLGLRYLIECQVLVIAEPLPDDVVAVAAGAATYHGAALIVVTDADNAASEAGPGLPEAATVLELPDEDEGAFAELVGRYASRLDDGMAAADAWQKAVDEVGWEKAAE